VRLGRGYGRVSRRKLREHLTRICTESGRCDLEMLHNERVTRARQTRVHWAVVGASNTHSKEGIRGMFTEPSGFAGCGRRSLSGRCKDVLLLCCHMTCVYVTDSFALPSSILRSCILAWRGDKSGGAPARGGSRQHCSCT
jgi:hypothetical protein